MPPPFDPRFPDPPAPWTPEGRQFLGRGMAARYGDRRNEMRDPGNAPRVSNSTTQYFPTEAQRFNGQLAMMAAGVPLEFLGAPLAMGAGAARGLRQGGMAADTAIDGLGGLTQVDELGAFGSWQRGRRFAPGPGMGGPTSIDGFGGATRIDDMTQIDGLGAATQFDGMSGPTQLHPSGLPQPTAIESTLSARPPIESPTGLPAPIGQNTIPGRLTPDSMPFGVNDRTLQGPLAGGRGLFDPTPEIPSVVSSFDQPSLASLSGLERPPLASLSGAPQGIADMPTLPGPLGGSQFQSGLSNTQLRVTPTAMGPEDVMPGDRYVPPFNPSVMGDAPSSLPSSPPSMLGGAPPVGLPDSPASLIPPRVPQALGGDSLPPFNPGNIPAGLPDAPPMPGMSGTTGAMSDLDLSSFTSVGQPFSGMSRALPAVGGVAGLGALGAIGYGAGSPGAGAAGGMSVGRPGAFEPPAPPPPAEGGQSFDPNARTAEYTVQPGNSLSAIAMAMAGRRLDPRRALDWANVIARENGIADPNRIEPGQRLRLIAPIGMDPNQFLPQGREAPPPFDPTHGHAVPDSLPLTMGSTAGGAPAGYGRRESLPFRGPPSMF